MNEEEAGRTEPVHRAGRVPSLLRFMFFIMVVMAASLILAGCPSPTDPPAADDPVDTTVAVTGVSLDAAQAGLKTSKTLQLAATVSPSDATNPAVAWSTSSAALASVDASGLVTAVAAGTATITVTTADGGFTATCEVTVTGPDVYICGSVTDNGTNYQYGYWKNGAWNQVSGINPNALFMDGETVYLGGTLGDTPSTPAYWKTGGPVVTLSKLAAGQDGGVNDIVVHDGKVYCCGSTANESGSARAAVWIDGARTDLTTVEESHAYSIAVTSAAVYVVGDRSTTPESTFGYWRSTDGGVSWTWVQLAVEDDANSVSWRTYGGIFVDGEDVYVGGEKDADGTYKALYWKNGALTMVAGDSFLESHSRGIVLHQGTVYVGGEMWLDVSNGSVGVHDGGSGTWSVMATDGFGFTVYCIGFGGFGVSSKDVFMAGTVYDSGSSNYYPACWKNGTRVTLETPTGYPCGWTSGLSLVY